MTAYYTIVFKKEQLFFAVPGVCFSFLPAETVFSQRPDALD